MTDSLMTSWNRFHSTLASELVSKDQLDALQAVAQEFLSDVGSAMNDACSRYLKSRGISVGSTISWIHPIGNAKSETGSSDAIRTGIMMGVNWVDGQIKVLVSPKKKDGTSASPTSVNIDRVIFE